MKKSEKLAEVKQFVLVCTNGSLAEAQTGFG